MRLRLDVDGEQTDLEVEPMAGGYVIRIDGASYRTRTRLTADFVTVRVGRQTLRLRLRENQVILDGGMHRLRLVDVSDDRVATVEGTPTGTGASVDVRSSMPGRVVRVAVAAGSPVRRGETLVVLEAMKMQNEIPAPVDGVVRQVAVAEGETITANWIVASIEARGPSAS